MRELADTIVALSTPRGRGAICVIRMSGDKAIGIAKKVFSPFPKNARYLAKGNLKTKYFTDEAMCVFFDEGKSYTGEYMVEFHCHGGNAMQEGVIRQLIELGARASLAGEFTKRAYINGKLTLAQAEGISQMIDAESALSVRAGYNLLSQKLTAKLIEIQNQLTDLLAEIEAVLDYPEENIELITTKKVEETISDVKTKLQKLLNSFSASKIVKSGIDVALIGQPNVGKSSLFNALLDCDRAIVSSIKGTTRDVIDQSITYKDVVMNFYDTAGIRSTNSLIENEGVKRTLIQAKKADLLLLLTNSKTKKPHEIVCELLPNYFSPLGENNSVQTENNGTNSFISSQIENNGTNSSINSQTENNGNNNTINSQKENNGTNSSIKSQIENNGTKNTINSQKDINNYEISLDNKENNQKTELVKTKTEVSFNHMSVNDQFPPFVVVYCKGDAIDYGKTIKNLCNLALLSAQSQPSQANSVCSTQESIYKNNDKFNNDNFNLDNSTQEIKNQQNRDLNLANLSQEKNNQQNRDFNLVNLSQEKYQIINDKINSISLCDGHRGSVIISSKTGEGITELKELIYNMFCEGFIDSEELLLTNERQYGCLVNSMKQLNDIQISTLDCLSQSIKEVWLSLGEITGENTSQSIIDKVFEKFCLGK